MNGAAAEVYRNPEARHRRADRGRAGGGQPEHGQPEHGQSERGSEVIDFHRSIAGYAPTRLVEVPELAGELGVARLFVKEEAARFGLPAFKILGASYAVSRALSARCGVPDRALPIDELSRALTGAGPIELVAATDGNHGRAVAHTAALLGLPARIFLPADITAQAKAAIAAEGARVEELAAPYDEVVRIAAEAAAGEDSVLVQDTSWEGYEQIPQWIVDGYGTVMAEAVTQLAERGVGTPDLVAVPVGVGSFAEAVVHHCRSGASVGVEAVTAPSVLSVEPEAAASLIASLRAGRLTAVPTTNTIMAGLNCGTPSAAAWPTLQAGVDVAVTVSDAAVAAAVRDLAGHGVDSGPCGAAALTGVRALHEADALPPESVVLLLSTEGRSANPLPEEFA